MPRPSKRQLATRAITATRIEKRARIGELREVEEVVGAAIVERGVRVAVTRTVRMKATLKFQMMSHHWNLIGAMTVYSPLAVLHKIVQSGKEENHRNTVADSHGRSLVLSNTPKVRGQFDLPPPKTHHLPTLITNHHQLRFDQF